MRTKVLVAVLAASLLVPGAVVSAQEDQPTTSSTSSSSSTPSTSTSGSPSTSSTSEPESDESEESDDESEDDDSRYVDTSDINPPINPLPSFYELNKIDYPGSSDPGIAPPINPLPYTPEDK